MPSFFPMPAGDRWYLLAVLIFALVSFLPWTRHIQLAGMALFGWLMAALMVFSPAIALIRLLLHSRRSQETGGRHDH